MSRILVRYTANGRGYINLDSDNIGRQMTIKYSNYIPYVKMVIARQMTIPKKFAGKRVEVEFE